jgi:hypothetical protein
MDSILNDGIDKLRIEVSGRISTITGQFSAIPTIIAIPIVADGNTDVKLICRDILYYHHRGPTLW